MTVDSFRCAIVLAHDCLMIPVLRVVCVCAQKIGSV